MDISTTGLLGGASQANTSSGSTTSTNSNEELGKDQFLELLVAQIANQDPLNPMDDKEFIAQLAQFSSLEQQIQSNEQLSLLSLSQSAVVNSQVTGLIGKEVSVSGNQAIISEVGQGTDISFRLGNDAAQVMMSIYNADGDLVRDISVGSKGQGPHTLAWDGMSNLGVAVPVGEYSVEINAFDGEGTAVDASTSIKGKVEGVTYAQGYPELIVGEARVRPSDVIAVSEVDSSANENAQNSLNDDS